MAQKASKTLVSISIDTHLLRRLDDVANAQHLSRSAMIEDCIEQQICSEEAFMKAFANPVLGRVLAKFLKQPEVLKGMGQAFGAEMRPDELAKFQRVMVGVENQLTNEGKKKGNKK